MSISSPIQAVPIPAAAGAVSPSLPVPHDDRWTTWQASERQRDADSQYEIRTALLLMVVAIAFGGAVYLSFGGQR